jgi:hypothetical protein
LPEETDLPVEEENSTEGIWQFMYSAELDDPERNRRLMEDIEYFRTEIVKQKSSAFAVLSEEAKAEFNSMVDTLIEEVDTLRLTQIFVRIAELVAFMGDAHARVNIFDGYYYPLNFYIFNDELYIINADKPREDLLNSKVLKINGVEASEILNQMERVIPHENEYWVKTMLPQTIQQAVYLRGLDFVLYNTETIFTIEKDNIVSDVAVPVLSISDPIVDFIFPEQAGLFAVNDSEYYDYSLIDDTTLLFNYNVCSNQPDKLFMHFNKEMFDVINENNVDRIIIDVRRNTGGSGGVFTNFTNNLKTYVEKNPEVKVFVLVGRMTFSAGVTSVSQIIEAVPSTVSVGESTGGGVNFYGSAGESFRTITTPNLQFEIGYGSMKVDLSKVLPRQDPEVNTFVPDVEMPPTIEDHINQHDAALEYCLDN